MAEYEIRPLNAKDIAPMARIIGKIGIRDISKTLSPESIAAITSGEGASVERIGASIVLDAIGIVCANADKAEADIFGFLASVSGMKVKEVEGLSLADFAELVTALFKAPDFSDFFTRVSSLTK